MLLSPIVASSGGAAQFTCVRREGGNAVLNIELNLLEEIICHKGNIKCELGAPL